MIPSGVQIFLALEPVAAVVKHLPFGNAGRRQV